MRCVELFGSLGHPSSSPVYPNMQVAHVLDTADRGELIEKYDDLIRYIAQGFSRRVSIDDLIQEGRMALLHSADLWDPDRGTQFWTYARPAIIRWMVRWMTQECAEACAVGDIESLSGESSDIDTRLSLETGLRHLSELELKVLHLSVVADTSIRGIAEQLGMSKSSVDRIYQEAIVKLRDRIGGQV